MDGRVDVLAVVAGIVFVLGGVVLLAIAVFGIWPLAIYGLILLVVGIVILMTLKQQEQIERIKGVKNKRKEVFRRK